MLTVAQKQERILLITTLLAVSFIHISIALSQVLLGIGIGMTLVYRKKLEFPRIWVPLVVFVGLTLLSLLMSPDPRHGWPQLRKFFVFLLIPLVYGVLSRCFLRVYYLLIGWTITATASGIWGLV